MARVIEGRSRWSRRVGPVRDASTVGWVTSRAVALRGWDGDRRRAGRHARAANRGSSCRWLRGSGSTRIERADRPSRRRCRTRVESGAGAGVESPATRRRWRAGRSGRGSRWWRRHRRRGSGEWRCRGSNRRLVHVRRQLLLRWVRRLRRRRGIVRARRRLLGPSHRASRARGHLCLGRWCWCGRHKCSGCHSTRRCRLLCWSRVSPAHIDSKHARTHTHKAGGHVVSVRSPRGGPKERGAGIQPKVNQGASSCVYARAHAMTYLKGLGAPVVPLLMASWSHRP